MNDEKIYGKVLILFLAAALLATPALAETGKGYGKRLLARSEKKQVAATECTPCPMGGPHSGNHDVSGQQHHTQGR